MINPPTPPAPPTLYFRLDDAGGVRGCPLSEVLPGLTASALAAALAQVVADERPVYISLGSTEPLYEALFLPPISGQIALTVRPATVSKSIQEDLQQAADQLQQQTLQLAQANQQLESQERVLEAFQLIGEMTLASLDHEEILDTLGQEIIKAGIFRSLMIAMVDEPSQTVQVKRSFNCKKDENGTPIPGSVGISDPRVIGLTYSLDHTNITAEVARCGRMEVIEGWDKRFDIDASKYTDFVDKLS
jgi:hypothetical protein